MQDNTAREVGIVANSIESPPGAPRKLEDPEIEIARAVATVTGKDARADVIRKLDAAFVRYEHLSQSHFNASVATILLGLILCAAVVVFTGLPSWPSLLPLAGLPAWPRFAIVTLLAFVAATGIYLLVEYLWDRWRLNDLENAADMLNEAIDRCRADFVSRMKADDAKDLAAAALDIGAAIDTFERVRHSVDVLEPWRRFAGRVAVALVLLSITAFVAFQSFSAHEMPKTVLVFGLWLAFSALATMLFLRSRPGKGRKSVGAVAADAASPVLSKGLVDLKLIDSTKSRTFFAIGSRLYQLLSMPKVSWSASRDPLQRRPSGG